MVVIISFDEDHCYGLVPGLYLWKIVYEKNYRGFWRIEILRRRVRIKEAGCQGGSGQALPMRWWKTWKFLCLLRIT